MYRHNDEMIVFIVLGGVVLTFLFIFFCLGVNSCTSHEFENGIIVDKYRNGRSGTPHLVIEKNDDFGDIVVDEKDYYEYDIGEIYAQEQ